MLDDRGQTTTAIHDQLYALLGDLMQGPNSGHYLRHPDLEALCQRLDATTDETRRVFQEMAAPLASSLHEIGVVARQKVDLGKDLRRDLRTVVRRLRCVFDAITRAGFEVGGTREQLSVDYTTTDVAQLVRRTANAFRNLARSRQISFEVTAPPSLMAQVDARKIELILLNLLFNAFKFTPPGRVVTCRLDADEEDEQSRIAVTDEGPGISPGHMGGVFTRSRQLDRSVCLDLGGLGFGLSTSRDFAWLHGGDIILLSDSNAGGCTFRATFPRRAPRGCIVSDAVELDSQLAEQIVCTAEAELITEARLGSKPTNRSDRPLVLVVEDNRSIHRILVECLESMCDTASAFDGVDGLAKATELDPDLIVSDIVMPEMDGETMIRELRKTKGLSDTPVLVLTGSADPMQTIRLLEGGAQDALRKPFLLPEVRARVAGLLESKRTRDILIRSVGKRNSPWFA
ncbi:MAG: hybrid sensor histidine kinase/response regulator [Myxococcota bacterium]